MERRESSSARREGGFALVETLAVMLIIGLLAAIIVPQIQHWREKVHLVTVTQDARVLGMSIEKASMEFDEYVDIETVTNASTHKVTVTSLDSYVHMLNPDSKVTGYERGTKDFTISVYYGESPSKAVAYATYNAKMGGICKAGYGPVQSCDVLQAVPAPTPTTTSPVVPVAPVPTTTAGTPDAPIEVVTPTSFQTRPGPITAVVCPESQPIINDLRDARATEVNLVFNWTAAAGATNYIITLVPQNGSASTLSFTKRTSGTTATFNFPRQPLDQYGNPTGPTPDYYSDYSLRIQADRNGIVGDPYYRVFQFKHWNLGCNPQDVVPWNDRVPPMGFVPTDSVTATSVRKSAYEDVTFQWGASTGATDYLFTIVNERDGKYGAEVRLRDNKITVRFPRKALDQYGNPVGGDSAPYYDSYRLRIQPSNATRDGDARYRIYRFFHWENGIVHSPDGYY